MEELTELSQCWQRLEQETLSKLDTMIKGFEGQTVQASDCEAIQASWNGAHQTISRTSRQLDKVANYKITLK